MPSYLTRREGRYVLQIRNSKLLFRLLGTQLYRLSLRTSDYRVARTRLLECLHWYDRMNNVGRNTQFNPAEFDAAEVLKLLEAVRVITEQATEYLEERWPVSEDRLVARRSFVDCSTKALNKASEISRFLVEAEPVHALLVQLREKNAELLAFHHSLSLKDEYARGSQEVLQTIFTKSNMDVFNGMPMTPALANSPSTEAAKMVLPVTDILSGANTNSGKRFSQCLADYREFHDGQGLKKDSLAVVNLVVQFIVDEFDDPFVAEFDKGRCEELDLMLVDIPDRQNVPKSDAGSLSKRYQYAQNHGWEGLKRLTEARLRNGYHNALSKFFGWMKDKGYYPHEKPTFNHISGENLVSLPRDSFSANEVVEILSMPLFTGCAGGGRIWKPGDYLVQNHLYWAYVLLFLTGLRPGELGQLECDDFRERDGIWYLHLQSFDPSKGRIAIKDLRRFKTRSSERIVPLHPLILDLGLLDRIDELRSANCPVVFPEWEPYPKPDGELRWGQPITKSWQYLKSKTSITRKDVTVYSTRHWFADLVDDTDLTHRARKRLMGHSTKEETSVRYGSKTRLTNRDLKEITDIQSPTIEAMSEILLNAKDRADRGELEYLKPWTYRTSWSDYYKKTIGDAG